MCVFLPAFSVTQATNSSDFFDKEYLAAFGRAQASLALLLLARYFFFEEVFSSWHSKQASSAHDLTKTFLSFLYFRENGRLNHIRNEQRTSKERKKERGKNKEMAKKEQGKSKRVTLQICCINSKQHSTMW